MGGHSDLLLGHVACRAGGELLAKIDRYRTLTGGVAGPMEAWLLARSLATLPLRLERSSANALAVAEFLEGKLGGVVYPGLKGHPGHEVARGQMRYFGPVMGFALESRDAGGEVSGGLRVCDGGYEFWRDCYDRGAAGKVGA